MVSVGKVVKRLVVKVRIGVIEPVGTLIHVEDTSFYWLIWLRQVSAVWWPKAVTEVWVMCDFKSSTRRAPRITTQGKEVSLRCV